MGLHMVKVHSLSTSVTSELFNSGRLPEQAMLRVLDGVIASVVENHKTNFGRAEQKQVPHENQGTIVCRKVLEAERLSPGSQGGRSPVGFPSGRKRVARCSTVNEPNGPGMHVQAARRSPMRPNREHQTAPEPPDKG